MKQVAVLGYGTVGSGVVQVIDENKDVIARRVGEELNVKYILDLRDFPGDPNENKVVHDAEIILQDEEISVVCETMGGLEPAFTFTKKALSSGKSVCTSNKELVAAHGPELLALAKENNCNYMFEASVGGGIPIIRPLMTCLTAEKITGIEGILNGTTNYILTKMADIGADFDVVLKEAQEKGYAERNPAADVEGYDACRKIAILSSLVFGENVNFEDVYTEGITKITPVDFAYAKKLNKQIKLIGKMEENENGRFAMVSPRLIGGNSPLTCVQDVFNGILVHSNMLDDSMYYGRGAGKLPTASAVVGDVVECAKMAGKNLPCNWVAKDAGLSPIDELSQQYFLRVNGSVAERKAELEANFGEITVVELEEVSGEFGVVTGVMKEKEYRQAAEKLAGIIGMIRI